MMIAAEQILNWGDSLLYPLLFEPIYKSRIWGGERIGQIFDRQLPSNDIGESWDVACHKNGTSLIANGPHKGRALDELIEEYGRRLMGTALDEKDIEKFPLLIKILDASQLLSVQVHPGDEYAALHENGELGKTEMWYIIDAEPDAYLYYGVKPGVDADAFRAAIERGDVEPYLCALKVEEGDVLYIPSGMVHAIGSGIVICEIQQNSDTTYRVFDWNRTDDEGNPRELHTDKALDVIDFEGRYPSEKVKGIRVDVDGGFKTYFVAGPYFAMEKLEIERGMDETAEGDKFYILTIVSGQGSIDYDGGSQPFKAGDSIMIPAGLGEYTIRGGATVLKSYIPDREKDIISVLEAKGYSRKDMEAIAGLFD